MQNVVIAIGIGKFDNAAQIHVRIARLSKGNSLGLCKFMQMDRPVGAFISRFYLQFATVGLNDRENIPQSAVK